MINAIASNENNEEILVDDLSDLLESLLYNEEIIPQDLAFLYPHVDSLVNKYKDQEDFVGYLLPISDLSFWVQRISPKGKELLKDYLLQRFGSEKLKKTLAGHEADMFQLIDDNEKEEYHQTREKTKEELEKAIKSNPKLDQFMQLITDFQREVDKNQLIE